MRINRDDLRRRAIFDLTNRARGGIAIYLLIWLTITLPKDIHVRFPEFFVLNTAILGLLFLSRLLHYLLHTRPAQLDAVISHNWLVWTILLGALHWGLICGWVLIHPAYEELSIYLVACAAVLGIAGTTALSISAEIRLLFPPFVLGPSVAALLYRGQNDDLISVAMIIIALLYVFVTSRTAGGDYWQAIRSSTLAENRALIMEKLSVTDQLTGLHNRRYVDQFVETRPHPAHVPADD